MMDLENPSLALNTKENIPDTMLQNPSDSAGGESAESETFLQLLHIISAVHCRVFTIYLDSSRKKKM